MAAPSEVRFFEAEVEGAAIECLCEVEAKILVGTITYNGQLTTHHTGSTLALWSELQGELQWKTTGGTLLEWARNTLASLVFENGHSDLLFIDSDMDG